MTFTTTRSVGRYVRTVSSIAAPGTRSAATKISRTPLVRTTDSRAGRNGSNGHRHTPTASSPCSVSATTRSVPGGGPSIVVAASSVSRRDWPPRQLTSARYRTTRSRPGRYCNPAPVSPRKSPSARSITGRSTSTACGPVRYAAAGRSGSSIVIPKSWPVVTRRQSSSTNLASSKPFHRSKRRTHRNPTSRHAATTRPDAPPHLVIAPIRLPLDIRRYAHANCNSSPNRIVIS